MKRFHDWQVRFERFARERAAQPFAWGTNDCCTFAADCILTLTGTDVALPELRTHRTELEAAELLKAHGGVVGVATAALGQSRPVLMAQIGDVVLTDTGNGDTLAICNGSTCMVPGPKGVVNFPMADARLCWRVG